MTLGREDLLTKHPIVRSHVDTYFAKGYIARVTGSKTIFKVVLYGNDGRFKGYVTTEALLSLLQWQSDKAIVNQSFPKR
jgi:hypothetical protein